MLVGTLLSTLKVQFAEKVCWVGPAGRTSAAGICVCGLEGGRGWGKGKPPSAGSYLPCLFPLGSLGSQGLDHTSLCQLYFTPSTSPEFRIQVFSLIRKFGFQLVKIPSSRMALWPGAKSSFLSVYTNSTVIWSKLYLEFPQRVFLCCSEKQSFSHPLFPA